MADEVYKKVGRGGAGNFYSKKDVEDVQKAVESSDLEAQPVSSTTADPLLYLHTGRGGAGNFVQPSQLTSQGLTQDAPPLKKIVVGAAKPSYRGGRGGAGNYVDAAEEERLKREEEERVRRENEEAVVRDVERGLARPEKAHGVGGGSWEMGDVGR